MDGMELQVGKFIPGIVRKVIRFYSANKHACDETEAVRLIHQFENIRSQF